MNLKILYLLLLLVFGSSPFLVGSEVIDIPVFGEVDIAEMPLFVCTLLIASADGFNPCSIWVLLFLLGMIIHTRSRKTVLLVGTTFLLVTASVYGLFIAGILNVLDLLIHMQWIKYLVAIFAGVFGIVNIKDYFWFKRGVSFTISNDQRSWIGRKARELMQAKGVIAPITGIALLAAGVAIIELPCTAGLPLIWGGLVVSAGVTTSYIWYLLFYLLVYLSIEIVILLIVIITLRSFKMGEFAGRALKLIGGVLILALGIVLVVDKAIMYNTTYAFGIILGALILSFAIIGIDLLIRKFARSRAATPPNNPTK